MGRTTLTTLLLLSVALAAGCGSSATPAAPDMTLLFGTHACADLITSNAWSTTLTQADFVSQDAFMAYTALNLCACMTAASAGGCQDLCQQPDDGTTTPNFCNGVAPLAPCELCLDGMGTGTGATNCATQYASCTSD